MTAGCVGTETVYARAVLEDDSRTGIMNNCMMLTRLVTEMYRNAADRDIIVLFFEMILR
jgi:hypothetical protein